jgi:hypothetical protein
MLDFKNFGELGFHSFSAAQHSDPTMSGLPGINRAGKVAWNWTEVPYGLFEHVLRQAFWCVADPSAPTRRFFTEQSNSSMRAPQIVISSTRKSRKLLRSALAAYKFDVQFDSVRRYNKSK